MYCKPDTRFIFLTFLLILSCSHSFSQLSYDSIKAAYVQKTIDYLASNKLKGRVNFTPEQLEAAEFIGHEFELAGLDPFPGVSNFYIPFRGSTLFESNEKLQWNERRIDDSLFLYIPSHLIPDQASLDEFMVIQAGYPLADSLLFFHWNYSQYKTLIWVSLPDNVSYSEATKNIVLPPGMPTKDILIAADKEEPKRLNYVPNKNQVSSVLYNIVGMLPGDSLPEEAIIFSAHYDHIDRGIKGETGEIFNGANDDASGTTAVLALAHYFAQRHDNRRTILFCLFAGEELGLFGSNAFVNMIVPDKIKAMLNIEMIGMTNATGKNAFMLTGSSYSDLFKILSRNLKNEKVNIRELTSDPKQLFQRSDNYSFAQRGIPAHTIMCSDDNEPCYHKSCDDSKRIDINNMTNIIRAIGISATSLINGTDTPTRLKN